MHDDCPSDPLNPKKLADPLSPQASLEKGERLYITGFNDAGKIAGYPLENYAKRFSGEQAKIKGGFVPRFVHPERQIREAIDRLLRERRNAEFERSHSEQVVHDARSPSRPSRIFRPPGSLLYKIAEFVFKKKTLQQVVEPTLSDLQNDYFAALSQGRKWKAKWIRVRDTIGLVKALGLSSVVQLIKEFFRFAK